VRRGRVRDQQLATLEPLQIGRVADDPCRSTRDPHAHRAADVARSYEFLVGGRNLHPLENGGDTRKIARRRIAFDWNHTGPCTGIFSGGLYDVLTIRGYRSHDDPSYHC